MRRRAERYRSPRRSVAEEQRSSGALKADRRAAARAAPRRTALLWRRDMCPVQRGTASQRGARSPRGHRMTPENRARDGRRGHEGHRGSRSRPGGRGASPARGDVCCPPRDTATRLDARLPRLSVRRGPETLSAVSRGQLVHPLDRSHAAPFTRCHHAHPATVPSPGDTRGARVAAATYVRAVLRATCTNGDCS